jgi:hypothetical protein
MPSVLPEPVVGGLASSSRKVAVADGESVKVTFGAGVAKGHVMASTGAGITGTITPVSAGVQGDSTAVPASDVTNAVLDPAPSHVLLTATGGDIEYGVIGR